MKNDPFSPGLVPGHRHPPFIFEKRWLTLFDVGFFFNHQSGGGGGEAHFVVIASMVVKFAQVSA